MAEAVLYKANGTPMRPGPRARPSERIGTSGAVVYGTELDSVERSSDLIGSERYRTFSRILANVSIVAAGVRHYVNLLSNAGWKVEANDSGHPDSQMLAEETEKILFESLARTWTQIVRRASMYRFYGFHVAEWTSARREDGSIGFIDVEPRPQRTIEEWDVDDHGGVRHAIQRNPKTFAAHWLPRWKILYLVDDTLQDDPEGLGLFRHLAEPARRLQRYEQLEGYGMENDLRGIPIARWPEGIIDQEIRDGITTETDKELMKKPLKDFVKGHTRNPDLGFLLDSSTYRSTDDASTPSSVPKWDVTLLRGDDPSVLSAASSAIERVTRDLAMILGVEHLLYGTSGEGSLAMSQDKSRNFATLVAGSLKDIAAGVNRDLIRPLWILNGWPDEARPKAKPDAIQHRSIEEITGALKDMAAAGSLLGPEDPAIAEIRDLLGLSRPSKFDEEMGAGLGGGGDRDRERGDLDREPGVPGEGEGDEP